MNAKPTNKEISAKLKKAIDQRDRLAEEMASYLDFSERPITDKDDADSICAEIRKRNKRLRAIIYKCTAKG